MSATSPRLCCSQEEAVWICVGLPSGRPQQHTWHISDTKGTKKVQKRYKQGTKKVQKRYHNRQLSSVYHLYHICTVVDFLRYGLQQRVDATIVHAIISLAQTASGTVCHCGKTCQGRQRFWRCSPSHWQNEFCDLDACGRCRTLPSSQVINIQYR